MSIYSLKMRASKHTGSVQEHVSGAEKILPQQELPQQMEALLSRALHHAKGKADFINLKIEAVAPENLQYIEALPVSTHEAANPTEGRQFMCQIMTELGLTPDKCQKILELFQATYGMRGAMLLDVDTLERLEPDQQRGIRATYMDSIAPKGEAKAICDGKNHFQEALVLASKVLSAPNIIGELCMSDDPDYITGYIATRDKGYIRITQLKEMGCPHGGRIFLYRGPKSQVEDCIKYLQEQRVLVKNVPANPYGNNTPKPKSASDKPWQIFQDILAQKKSQQLYRNTKEISSAQAAHIIYQGQNQLMLASNDYLGLIDHPEIKEAAKEAINIYGVGSGGSRLTTGTLPLHNQLESALASFKHTEKALIFNTGYMANVGIISALGVKDSIIFSDELNHASIIDGCRLSHAKTVVYKHNDMKDLAEKLQEHAGCQGLIVTDAVFSMGGDIAPLPDIMVLAEQYHVLTMVDEAHATGVIGATGRGIVEHFGLKRQPDVLMGTLSKALAAEGGYVCGNQLLIDYLRNTARSYIFSTSLSPAVLAAATKALELLENQPSMVHQLQENTRIFCKTLQQEGIEAHSDTAIVPIVLHDEELSLRAAEELNRQNIFISPIRYPTVPKGQAMLRAALMATHTPEELRQAAHTIGQTISRLADN